MLPITLNFLSITENRSNFCVLGKITSEPTIFDGTERDTTVFFQIRFIIGTSDEEVCANLTELTRKFS